MTEKEKKKFRISFLEFSDGTWMKRGWVETDVLEGELTYDEIDKIKKLLIDKYNFQLKKATE
jgi:hypothetical protein